eukprot:TRINITY_DN13334_c0_g1_i1.p1 TRINITY_DN13334_c0_g1~~TRINITY_DN13334_c0_g1_i1.p1  ORF type:complete len:228 (+),score=33.51 TRINITY_DN13334_c0_g1_i1:44-727(+)
MAWRCSGKTNLEMVTKLKASGVIQSTAVEQAMLRVDRKKYVRESTEAYQDSPQPIGYSVTVSAPHMHAMCLEHMKEFLVPGGKVLDCGSGSGYLTACMRFMVGEGGSAYGMEFVKELVPWSIENCKNDGFTNEINDGSIQLLAGDASRGWPSKDKFNAIHVGAAAPEIPKPLVDSLTSPGCLLLPVGVNTQNLVMVKKSTTGHVTVTKLTGVMYVPFHMKDTEAYKG